MKVPAQFKYNGVIDLLCDAVFQFRLAAGADDSYVMNRHARASIMSSVLALESAANGLLLSLKLDSKFANDIDKLPVIAKFEAFLRLGDSSKDLNRGTVQVQRVKELLRARNDYVHPKVKSIATDVDELQNQDNMVALPLELTAEQWASVGIPKRPIFWSADSARSSLVAVTEFLSLIIRDHANFSPEDSQNILHSRVEVGDVNIVSTFNEFIDELKDTSDLGVDFAFLGIQ